MSTQALTYGDVIQAPYVLPHPTRRREYVSEQRPARVEGFSHPSCAARGWGWRGDVLVRFEDGSRAWVGHP